MKTLSSNRKLFFKLPPTPHSSSITLQPSPLIFQSYGWIRSLTLMKPFLYQLFSALQFCSVILHHIARRNNPPTSKPNLHHPSLWQCPAASWYGEGILRNIHLLLLPWLASTFLSILTEAAILFFLTTHKKVRI